MVRVLAGSGGCGLPIFTRKRLGLRIRECECLSSGTARARVGLGYRVNRLYRADGAYRVYRV